MPLDEFMDPPALPLWPGEPPYAFAHQGAEETTNRPPQPCTLGPNRAVTRVSQPLLYVHEPARPCGAAVLVCPGGGFRYLEIDKEGHEIARWLVGLGVTAVVLKYRTRPDTDQGSPRAMPDEVRRAINSDALQAMRTVRAHAHEWGIRPERIGAMGFSAGGRIAASLATMWRDTLPPDGPLSEVSARPDFVAPIYPGISEELAARVDAETPPAFMAVADDDREVPPENCLRLYDALRQAKVSAEMHIYRRGSHGFALRTKPGSPAAGWPDAFTAWMADLGMLGS
jgi:acetyl esterase/lipase